MSPPWRINPMTHCTMSEYSYHRATSLSVLFNNAFYLLLYGIRHFVKKHSMREKACCYHFMSYSFWIAARDLAPFCRQQWFFYMHYPTDRIAYTMAFITPVVEHSMGTWNSCLRLMLISHVRAMEIFLWQNVPVLRWQILTLGPTLHWLEGWLYTTGLHPCPAAVDVHEQQAWTSFRYRNKSNCKQKRKLFEVPH